jgi:aminopeptidase N
VHLYTNEIYPDGYHFWLNEGFATYMGGSSGYDLDWHIEKLKAYIIENPDFEI